MVFLESVDTCSQCSCAPRQMMQIAQDLVMKQSISRIRSMGIN
jgi:hypothetical protein